MKITLAYDIYNKEKWIESLLDSWISRLSGKNEYEIILVFDDCKDNSVNIAKSYLENLPYEYQILFADDKFEIFCNNLALENSTGDFVLFIQDDNWMYDNCWDYTISEIIKLVPNIGCIGLLAGIKMLPTQSNLMTSFEGFLSQILRKLKIERSLSELQYYGSLNYERLEINRLHKDYHISIKDLDPPQMGVWQVDGVNRPFCISRSLLLSKGGLDKEFMPSCGDDLDLSIKLLKDGRTNIYIPFDVLNITASNKTMTNEFINNVYLHAYRLLYKRYHSYFGLQWKSNTKLLYPLDISEQNGLFIKNDY